MAQEVLQQGGVMARKKVKQEPCLWCMENPCVCVAPVKQEPASVKADAEANLEAIRKDVRTEQ